MIDYVAPAPCVLHAAPATVIECPAVTSMRTSGIGKKRSDVAMHFFLLVCLFFLATISSFLNAMRIQQKHVCKVVEQYQNTRTRTMTQRETTMPQRISSPCARCWPSMWMLSLRFEFFFFTLQFLFICLLFSFLSTSATNSSRSWKTCAICMVILCVVGILKRKVCRLSVKIHQLRMV